MSGFLCATCRPTRRLALVSQLDQVCQHAVGCGGHDRRVQAGVDAVDERTDGLGAGRQRLEHLLFALGAMLQVLVDQPCDVLDDRSVAGEKPGWREVPDPAQRSEVFRKVAPLAGGDDDRSPAPGEIAAVEIARLFVEEAEMVRRVPGGVQRDQPRVPGGDDLRRPGSGPARDSGCLPRASARGARARRRRGPGASA